MSEKLNFDLKKTIVCLTMHNNVTDTVCLLQNVCECWHDLPHTKSPFVTIPEASDRLFDVLKIASPLLLLHEASIPLQTIKLAFPLSTKLKLTVLFGRLLFILDSKSERF